MRKSILKYYKLTFFCLVFSGALYAQDNKVGLVLSGGGSKGLAHIGVIRALEENNIPIDYITGTSMGAIIGGLYAAGYSPDEMETIFMSSDFPKWISGRTDVNDVYYFRKSYPNPAFGGIDLDIKKGLKPVIPTNIVSTKQLDFMFAIFFAEATAGSHGNFDSLMIPFRCVATEVDSGRHAVALKSGDLAKSLRASMTFPLYFNPIRVNGKLLFDGGIVDNFPEKLMETEFNPDFIIGSKTADDRPKMEDDNVLSHVENIVMDNTDFSFTSGNGILIEPRVPASSVIDFSDVRKFIDIGYLETMKHMDAIKARTPRQRSIAETDTLRSHFKAKCPLLKIDSIGVKGLQPAQQEYLKDMFFYKSNQASINTIASKYMQCSSDPKIKSIYPSINYDSTSGSYHLNIQAKEDQNIYTEFGGNISSSTVNEAFFKVTYEYWRKAINSMYANIYIGQFYNSVDFRIRRYMIAKRPFFLELNGTINNWNYFKTSSYFYEDLDPAYLIENEKDICIQAGIPVFNWGKITLGAGQEWRKDYYFQKNDFSRSDTADVTSYRPFVAQLLLEINTLNYPLYPTRGSLFQLRGRYNNGHAETTPGSTNDMQEKVSRSLAYFSLEFNLEQYFKVYRRFTFGYNLAACYSDMPLLSNYTISMLYAQAYYPTPESKTKFMPDFRANQYFAVGLKGIFSIFKSFDFRSELYTFTPYRLIRSDENYKPYYADAFAFGSMAWSNVLVYHSPIGPLSLALNSYFLLSKSELSIQQQNLSLVFNIGIVLFNPKAMK